MSSTIEYDYAPICDLYERHLGSVLFEPYAIDLAHRVAENCAEGDRINIQTVRKECYSSTARSLAIGLIEGAPILVEIQERGGSPGPIVDAVATALARTGGDNPYRSTMQAIVTTARAKE